MLVTSGIEDDAKKILSINCTGKCASSWRQYESSLAVLVRDGVYENVPVIHSSEGWGSV